MSNHKIIVAALTLSASGFLGLVGYENYVGEAMIPTKNDRPTLGFGSTLHEDGTPVKLGEKTTPVKALNKAAVHISKDEAAFRKSLPEVTLSQAEYDIYIDFVYQYGMSWWNRSGMRRNLLMGRHIEACHSLLEFKKSGGYDCSIPGNKICGGVWTRQRERHKQCLEAQ